MKKVITAMALLLVTAGVGTVGAATRTTYAATMCKAGTGSFSDNFGTAENWGSVPTHVACPVVRHGSSIASGYVRVRDLSSTNDVNCELYSLFVSGHQIFLWDSRVRTTVGTFSTSYTQHNFNAVPADPAGYYFMSCDIPAVSVGASALANYSVMEN